MPEKRDDKILYDLNANIRKESRKVTDPDVVIQNMLIEFKNNNPNIMKKLQDEKKSTKASVSDEMQHYRSIDNSKSNSINVISSDISTENEPRNFIMVQAMVHRTENEPNNSNRQNHTGVKSSSELLSTILQYTDTESKEESSLQFNIQSTSNNYAFDRSNIHQIKRNKILAEDTSNDDNKPKNKSKFRPPLKISDSDSSCYNNVTESDKNRNDTLANCNLNKALELETLQRILNTSPTNLEDSEMHENIPSSYEAMQINNELENPKEQSAMQNSSQESSQNECQINLQSAIFQNLEISDSEIHEMLKKDKLIANFNTEENLNSQCSETSCDSQINEKSIDEIVDSDVQNIDKDRDGEEADDTNIADAPTQVLDTSTQSDSDILSTIDEVLMRETLAEINNDVGCIVLTPPENFRDFF